MTTYEEYRRKMADTKAALRNRRGRMVKRPTKTRVFDTDGVWRWECACGALSWRHGMTETQARADLEAHRVSNVMHQGGGSYRDNRVRWNR